MGLAATPATMALPAATPSRPIIARPDHNPPVSGRTPSSSVGFGRGFGFGGGLGFGGGVGLRPSLCTSVSVWPMPTKRSSAPGRSVEFQRVLHVSCHGRTDAGLALVEKQTQKAGIRTFGRDREIRRVADPFHAVSPGLEVKQIGPPVGARGRAPRIGLTFGVESADAELARPGHRIAGEAQGCQAKHRAGGRPSGRLVAIGPTF